MKRLLVAAALLVIVAPLLCGDTIRNVVASARLRATESGLAAENGLKRLEKLDRLDVQRQYGFIKSQGRDTSLGLGPAVPLLGVPLDQLKKFDSVPAPDLPTIVVDTGHVLHVVLAGDEIVSVVEVVHRDPPQGWTTAALGQQYVAERALDVIKALRLQVDQTVLVKVGGVRLVFVGFEKDGLLTLVPIN